MSYILLTVDVEDWFQVENFKSYIPFSSWSSHELRVEKNVHRLLDLFDSFGLKRGSQFTPQFNTLRCHSREFNGVKVQGSQLEESKEKADQQSVVSRQQGNESNNKSEKSCQSCLTNSTPKATFFVLGWLAERLPHLIREIHNRGHEVASHGYLHNMCYEYGYDALKSEISDSKKLLEDIIGSQLFGYRSPSFSINNDTLKIIEECGYLYDSSYNSLGFNSRYGRLDLSGHDKNGIAIRFPRTENSISTSTAINLKNASNQINSINSSNISDSFYELPISNLHIKNPFKYKLSDIRHPTSDINSVANPKDFIVPCGGGGYFRLIPFPIFKKVIRSILKRNNAYLFYVHPWEIDPKQPRVSRAAVFFQFRHYANLSQTYSKLLKLINSFPDSKLITCHQYITEL